MSFKEKLGFEDRVTIEYIHGITPKKISNGSVAVIIQSAHGSGWSSWNSQFPDLPFDPVVVDFIETKQHHRIIPYCQSKYIGGYFNHSETLTIEWVPENTEFLIHEHGGQETIWFKEKISWLKA